MTKNYKVEQMQARTLSWWRNRESEIDMEPPYQRRGRLWSQDDKSYLIDSILNGFDVPKLYIADFTWADSPLNIDKKAYAIIDGKQRLEAIFDFFRGNLVLSPGFVFNELPDLKLGGLGYQDLKKNYPRICELYDEYNLSVMRVMAQDEAPIKDLFVRLNRSKPLSGAEIRNAMNGPAPHAFRLIASHEIFKYYVPFVIKRGQDLNAAAKLVSFEFFGKPQETKKAELDKFTKQTASEKARLELAVRHVIDTLDYMSEIFLPKDRLLASAGSLPVVYWFVKNLPPRLHSKVREFLTRFEDERKINRDLAAINPNNPRVDQKYLLYDRLNRSTNDFASHVGKLEILEEKFKRFLSSISVR